MEKYIMALQGITYREWIMLQTAVTREFEHQKGEFEKKFKLANVEGVKEIIRIQFGQTLD